MTDLAPDARSARIELDIATFATLSVKAAIERIAVALNQIYLRDRDKDTGLDPDPSELCLLFDSAWIIVDRVYLLRNLLSHHLAHAPEGSPARTFLQLAPSAIAARNKMDHLHGQLDNLVAKTRKATAPLLGIITATILHGEWADKPFEYLDAIALSHSEFHHKQNFNPFPEDMFPFTPPIDHIRLHAFDVIVDLSGLAASVVAMTNALELLEAAPPDHNRRYRIVMRAHFNGQS